SSTTPPAALAGRRRLPTWSPSSPARWRATSTAPTCASTAAAPPLCEQPGHDLARKGEQQTVRYTLLGNSGLRVSELALGTMTFGTDWPWGRLPGQRRLHPRRPIRSARPPAGPVTPWLTRPQNRPDLGSLGWAGTPAPPPAT